MVYHATTQQLDAAYAHMVGCCEYANVVQHPDGQRALQLAQLQPGDSVLEIGAGSGSFIADAKRRVGAGVCIAVDAVQGFLNTDIPWALRNNGLTVHPAGTPGQQVRLLQANITDAGAVAAIRAVPGAPQRFDCIVALHVFHTIPANDRRQALVKLRQLLAPSGRLIVTMSARFTNIAPTAAEVATPVQFRTTGYTEAPGCNVLLQFMHTPRVQTAGGGPLRPAKVVCSTLQLSPDRFWTVAAQQAHDAATNAGFNVNAVRNVGKGDNFGLLIGRHSPPQPALDAMTVSQLGQATQPIAQQGRYACIARILQTAAHRSFAQSSQGNQDARDYMLVEALQGFAARDQTRVQDTNRFLPSGGVVAEAIEFTQVGVMVALSKV